jgi:hypothetical protein
LEIRKTSGGFGVAGCDACHTRHTFSTLEAKQPQACQTCHMGFDHPQWEMYSASKHGVRALLKQSKVLPETTAAPTCQDCHMQDGDHGVMTGWGFLAVKLPLPEDKAWAADQVTILQGLGVLDPDGKPTGRLDVVKAGKVARLTAEEQKLFVMFLEHHMRTFQGAFHDNPDYSLWYGWSEMQRDLTEIKEGAAEMRAKK